MRLFDLVILDLDGTLVDSEALLCGLVAETLAAHGHVAPARRAIAATIGLPLNEVFRRALPGVDERAIEAICVAYRAQANALEFVRRFQLYPDVASTLEELRAAGVCLVVGTSKGRSTSLDIVEHCGIRELLDEVVGGDCVEHGKPHPEMVEHARALYDIARERTLVVGDTSFDIEMGKAAGVATCAATYGMQGAEVLRSLGPTFMIDRFDALRALVVAPR